MYASLPEGCLPHYTSHRKLMDNTHGHWHIHHPGGLQAECANSMMLEGIDEKIVLVAALMHCGLWVCDLAHHAVTS